MTRRNFFLSDVLWERLEKLSCKDGLTKSDHVRLAIEKHLQTHERHDEHPAG